jgi:ABC-type cobalamin/Fe3+-siderophores transport system ATPase subunit
VSFDICGLRFRRLRFELDVPSLSLPAGRLTAVVGPNGAGKTTLLRCLAGLLPVASGAVRLGGDDLASLPAGERSRRLAFVPQEHAAAFNYAVRDFIIMGRAPYLGLFGSPSSTDEVLAAEALDFVGLPGYADRLFFEMSSGERRLILIARALAQDTPALLLDEPVTFLDPRRESEVMNLLTRLVAERGKTVVVTLHNLDMAARCADVLVVLKSGRVAACGRPQDVLSEDLLTRVYEIPMRILAHEGRTFIVR